MQSSLCRSSPPKVAIIYTTAVHQQCVTECQKHNELKILIKNTTKLGFKNMSHIHILFTMLIILNITTNRLTASTTSKTSYMLDFNEVFWHAEKRGKNAENAENMRKTRKNSRKTRKNTRKTRKLTRKTADSENFFADALRCGTPISKRERVALRTCCVADADYLPTSNLRVFRSSVSVVTPNTFQVQMALLNPPITWRFYILIS